MATAIVTYTHGTSAPKEAYYTDGHTDWKHGSLGYDDSHLWTVERIEADLAKTHKGQAIEILAID